MDQATLKNVLDYSPHTGDFVWAINSVRRKAGTQAGTKKRSGYIFIGISGKYYAAHRLAWIFVNGGIPPGFDIDHINGNRSDNRIDNLRLATRSQNLQNQRRARKDSKTGVLGVTIDSRSGRYRACIHINGTQRSLGMFKTTEEASAAYLEAKRRLHEFCTI